MSKMRKRTVRPSLTLALRLLQCHQLGIRLYEEDGCVYVQWLRPSASEAEDAVDFAAIYHEKTYHRPLPYKFPGGLVQCLDEIERVLEVCGLPSLLKQFKSAHNGGWKQRWGMA